MEKNKTTTSTAKKMGWIGISLCALCCALPIIGAALGMASLTTLSFYLEKISIIALGIAALLIWFAWYKKRKQAKACAASCDTNCDCKPETANQTR